MPFEGVSSVTWADPIQRSERQNQRGLILYTAQAGVDQWSDLYVCILFERRFRIPTSQSFRIGNTELSARIGNGIIIDIGPIVLLVCGEFEEFFFRNPTRQQMIVANKHLSRGRHDEINSRMFAKRN